MKRQASGKETDMMSRDTRYFLFLNAGHFLDHYFMLIFATVAALALSAEWGMSYAELLPYGAPGFAAFALCALPMGYLADRWSRDGMMTIFFIGIGVSSVLTGLAQTPFQLGAGLFFIGVFGAIYHPVGLAIVTSRWKKTGMRLAINGIWGNLGVGAAALVTGVLIDLAGWRTAFILPGLLSVGVALPYLFTARGIQTEDVAPLGGNAAQPKATKGAVWRVLLCVYLTATLGTLVFQSTTVALPEIFEERLIGLANAIATAFSSVQSASVIGALAFVVFATASLAQLITGTMLDRFGARPTLTLVTMVQITAFLIMPGLTDQALFLAALLVMLGVFGQVPVNDFLIGTTTASQSRARAFGFRYLVSFTAFSAALPLIAYIQSGWGFDGVFRALLICPTLILIASRILLPVAARAKTA